MARFVQLAGLALLLVSPRAVVSLISPATLPRRGPVYLTREAEKNGPLRDELEARGVACDELPCIAHTELEGAAQLPGLLASKKWQWVLVTSPEAASMLLEAWERASRPALRIATVGAGTSKVLAAGQMEVMFEPSKATGKVLAAELPKSSPDTEPVLYPASARAPPVVPDALRERGFVVERLDTYTTEMPAWTQAMKEAAMRAQFASFASPSAVETWVERVGTDVTAICIGETSGERAKALGFAKVHFPAKPGLTAWADLISQVVNGEI